MVIFCKNVPWLSLCALWNEAFLVQIKFCKRPWKWFGGWLFPHDLNAASLWQFMFAFSSCRVWDITDWKGETTFVLIYFKHNFSDCWFLRGCYICLSTVECTHTAGRLLFFPHPRLRDHVGAAAPLHCRLMSQLHLCSCSVVDVLSSQSSPHSHFTGKPRVCTAFIETKRRVCTHTVVPVMTSNGIILGLLQFWYSACLSVFWLSCSKELLLFVI